MALLSFILASLTALLTSFLSISPGALHGLVPWANTLSNRSVIPTPPAPTPSAPPKAFFVSDLWEEIPIVNLSTTDSTTPPPTATSSFVSDEEEDDEPLTEPLVEEPTSNEQRTAEDLLRELWLLLGKVIFLFTLNLNHLFVENPYLDWFPWRSRSQPGSRPAALQLASASPSMELNRRPPVVVDTVQREQQDRISKLEEDVKTLTSLVQEMQRRELLPVPSAPAVTLPTPQPPRFPQGQPVFSTGSAPPFPPPQHFGSAYRPRPQHAPPQPNWVPTAAAGSSTNQSILYDASK